MEFHTGTRIVRFDQPPYDWPIEGFKIAGLVQQIADNSGENNRYAVLRDHWLGIDWFTCGRVDAQNPARSVRVTPFPSDNQYLHSLRLRVIYTSVLIHPYDWTQPRANLTESQWVMPNLIAEDAVEGFANSLAEAYSRALNTGVFPGYEHPDLDFDARG